MVMTRIFSLSIVAAVGLLLTGCYKVEETVANIYVIRLEGDEQVPVSDAEVRLFAEGRAENLVLTPPKPPQTKASRHSTSRICTWQANRDSQSCSIECEKGTLSGTGLIKVEEMVTNEATVVME